MGGSGILESARALFALKFYALECLLRRVGNRAIHSGLLHPGEAKASCPQGLLLLNMRKGEKCASITGQTQVP